MANIPDFNSDQQRKKWENIEFFHGDSYPKYILKKGSSIEGKIYWHDILHYDSPEPIAKVVCESKTDLWRIFHKGRLFIDCSKCDHKNPLACIDKEKKRTEQRQDQDKLRQLLAHGMSLAMNTWELQTGRSIIDFAQASGLWTVTTDLSGLRTRTLMKYLHQDTVPIKRPNIMAVIRSLKYVFDHTPDDDRLLSICKDLEIYRLMMV
jgi:hypothetical protein